MQTRMVMMSHLEKKNQGSYVTTSNPQKLKQSPGFIGFIHLGA